MKWYQIVVLSSVFSFLILLFSVEQVKCQVIFTDNVSKKLVPVFTNDNILNIKDYLDDRVEITLDKRDGFYSRDHAVQILKFFFKDKQINNFKIKKLFYHTEQKRSCIATLSLDNSIDYNVSLFLQVEKNRFVIQQVKIQKLSN